MKLVVLCPHFAPDTAPTGRVMTRIVDELAERGHDVHVVTALPWYRDHAVEAGWEARVGATETTTWGTITRLNPLAGSDKRNLLRRAFGFVRTHRHRLRDYAIRTRSKNRLRRCDAKLHGR